MPAPLFFVKGGFAFLVAFTALMATAQEPVPVSTTEQQLENLAEATETETEDDSYMQLYQVFKKDRLNLNTADEEALRTFLFLSPLQVQQLISYRRQMGKLISFYELQAVPGWDVETIRKLQPYIYVGPAVSLAENLIQRLKGGDHTLLARYTQVLEKQSGFIAKDSTGPAYLGSPQRLLLRYKYQYKNSLQYGITAEKDAGETLFKGGKNRGFDFYSAHFFARNLGMVKHLALGDFTVNMGQGLLSWQALAFRKSADVMSIKRQADILRPYNSPAEFNFMRGAGITVQKGNWQATAFASYKKVSANALTDSAAMDPVVTSLQASGYHRTASELADKNTISQTSFGGNVSYRSGSFHAGANAVYHSLSAVLQKSTAPYHLFAGGGKTFTNVSLDYSYTYKNMHLFGETVADAQGNLATVNGWLASLNAKLDASLLYRHIGRAYNSLYSNAFTESTLPVNERGMYAGLLIKPFYGITINAYADVFSFPWLRYRVDRPSAGSEYLAQLTWRPDKQTELYTRYLNQNKAINLPSTGLPIHLTANRPRQTWRTHLVSHLSPELILKARAELLWFDKRSDNPENGFLMYTELAYRPLSSPAGGNIRFQYFETDSYNSRLYAFETDVLYSFTIPPSFGKGYRWYINFNYDVGRHFTLWARIAQTYYPEATTIGSGNDAIKGNHRTEVKVQGQLRF